MALGPGLLPYVFFRGSCGAVAGWVVSTTGQRPGLQLAPLVLSFLWLSRSSSLSGVTAGYCSRRGRLLLLVRFFFFFFVLVNRLVARVGVLAYINARWSFQLARVHEEAQCGFAVVMQQVVHVSGLYAQLHPCLC